MVASDIATAAGETFRRYQQECREFITLMTRCWLKGWPDRKPAIESCREVAHNYCDQAIMRLDYLLSENLLEPGMCGSLGDIHDRVVTKWSVADEAALVARHPAYKVLVAAREAAWLPSNPVDTEGPAEMAKGDPELAKAAWDFNDRVRAFNEELKELLATSRL